MLLKRPLIVDTKISNQSINEAIRLVVSLIILFPPVIDNSYLGISKRLWSQNLCPRPPAIKTATFFIKDYLPFFLVYSALSLV